METTMKAMEPRPYQIDIVNKLKSENGIVYLPTGSGKTYIATMVINHYAKEIKRPLDKDGKRVIFMCNTIALAKQQAQVLREYTDLQIGLYVGERSTDRWNRRNWETEVKYNGVLVGTTQILFDLVCKNHLKISQLCLVIIDECHHATGEHPMRIFLKNLNQMRDTATTPLPRIVGLTGVLLKDNEIENVEKDLDELEKLFYGRILTISDEKDFTNVLVHSTQPLEGMVLYESDDLEGTPITNFIKNMVDDIIMSIDNLPIQDFRKRTLTVDPVKKVNIKRILEDFVYNMEEWGLYAGYKSLQSVIEDLRQKIDRAETPMLRKLVNMVFVQCCYMKRLMANEMFGHRRHRNIPRIIKRFGTQKLCCLLYYLEAKFHNKEPKEMRCLIFVERRTTTKVLSLIVVEYFASNPHMRRRIKPLYMVGHSANVWIGHNATERARNKQAFERFRDGSCNTIICSSVLEEGIDVSACNLVLVLNRLRGFSSYVQTKGRARAKMSEYSIFVSQSQSEVLMEEVDKWIRIQSYIKKFLIVRSLCHYERRTNEYVEEMQPFMTEYGARLCPESSILLIHRYCQALPAKDDGNPKEAKFEALAKRGGFVASVELPSASTIKSLVYGDHMKTTKAAKASAAFKACIELYKNGELNEHFEPVTKYECIKTVASFYFTHWNKRDITDVNSGIAGTNHFRRLYERYCPLELVNALPTIGNLSYFYEIQVQPQPDYTSADPAKSHMLQLYQNYAIFISKKLPVLVEMPLYLPEGKLMVKISSTPVEIVLQDQQQLNALVRFHVLLFHDLVKVWPNFMGVNQRNEAYSYLIVPIYQQTIDWKLVMRFQKPEAFQVKLESKKWMLNQKPKNYLGNVICPYSSLTNLNSRYVVTKVHPAVNAVGEKSFEKNEFHLEVQELHGVSNFLNKRGASKAIQTKFFIAKECCNLGFPGGLWIKAMLLPNILTRLYAMLHAEALKRNIITYLYIHTTELLEPKPLEEDKSLLPASSKSKLRMSFPELTENQADEQPKETNLRKQNVYMVKSQRNKKIYVCTPLHEKPLKVPPIQILERTLYTKSHKLQPNGEQRDFVAALTPASVGDVYNMERLEVLGDSFLKFATSLYLMHKHPKWHEGFLTEVKSKLVSNQNLIYSILIQEQLPRIIASASFKPEGCWCPPLASLPPALKERIVPSKDGLNDFTGISLNEFEMWTNNISDEKLVPLAKSRLLTPKDISNKGDLYGCVSSSLLGDKTVADTVEAVIGACVKNFGIVQGFRVLDYMNVIKLQGEDVKINLLTLKLSSPLLRADLHSLAIEYYLSKHDELEQRLGYKFRDRAYLLQALTHPSYPTNRATGSYQTLEFAGDAILDFLITCFIHERCETFDPGLLSDLRQALVNNLTLSVVCTRHGFENFLLYDHENLQQNIKAFAEHQKEEGYQLNEQVQLYNGDSNRGRLKRFPSKILVENVEAPKALGDLVESLIAAVYFDSMDIEVTWRVIYKLFEREIAMCCKEMPINCVRKLYECTNIDIVFKEPQKYKDKVMVECSFKFQGRRQIVCGVASNKLNAKKSAGKLAYSMLFPDGDPKMVQMLQNISDRKK